MTIFNFQLPDFVIFLTAVWRKPSVKPTFKTFTEGSQLWYRSVPQQSKGQKFAVCFLSQENHRGTQMQVALARVADEVWEWASSNGSHAYSNKRQP